MTLVRHAPLALALLIAACQPASRDESPAAPPAQASAGERADAPPRPSDTVIAGEATYLERIKMPPGADLTVQLLALDGDVTRVLASVRKDDVAGPPYPFTLPYDAAKVPASGRYALTAELVGPDGERWFATPAPVAVVPGEGTPVELRMRRASGPATSPAPVAGSGPHHWECGELGVMSRHPEGAESMRLDANARAWTLPLAASASGARYADARGNEFWSKGATARLVVDGEPARDCVQARQASPWNQALLRGVSFRAVGNEPGWFVEVDPGEAPRLRATLDYGQRRIEADAGSVASGFVAKVDAGTLRLDIARGECTDGMSGHRFEARATLTLGERRYEGCGGWLSD